MKFTELTEEQKQRAIDETRIDENYLAYEWFDHLQSSFHAVLEALGFFDIESSFSGFYSQGDGASFTAFYEYRVGCLKSDLLNDEEVRNIAQRLVDINKKVKYDLGAEVSRAPSLYVHENTMRVETVSVHDRVGVDVVADAEEEFLQVCRDLARWYYDKLYDEYDYFMSDECIADFLVINDVEFDYEDNI